MCFYNRLWVSTEERGNHMFGMNKKQEELEQELLSRQSEAEQYLKKLTEAINKMQFMHKENETEITVMEEEQTELNTHWKELLEIVTETAKKAVEQKEKNQDLKKQVGQLTDHADKSEGSFQRSVEGIRRREEELLEMIGQGKNLTSPEEVLNLAATGMREEMDEICQCINEMEETEKKMGVLSLNAAIEAGRIGEHGRKFVEAAENVRDLSGKYHQSATFIAEKMKNMERRLEEVEVQIIYLAQIWKDHNARLERSAEGFSVYASRLEETETRSLVSQMQTVSRELERSIHNGENAMNQYEKAKNIVNQLDKNFIQQQEILKKIRGKSNEVEEWLQIITKEITPKKE